MIREIACDEVCRLEECLRQLAVHHNEVSVSFKGCYPKKPDAEVLASFGNDLRSGTARIAVAEDEGKILGFCKVSAAGDAGSVDYLIVLKEARGRGYGDALLGWATETLKQQGVSRIEVKVVDGNDAAGFYEKYGFRTCSLVLRRDL